MPSLPLHSTKKSLNQIYENFRLQSYKTFPLVNDTIIANNDTITEFMPFHIFSIIKNGGCRATTTANENQFTNNQII